MSIGVLGRVQGPFGASLNLLCTVGFLPSQAHKPQRRWARAGEGGGSEHHQHFCNSLGDNDANLRECSPES